jgi:hypothetical protein
MTPSQIETAQRLARECVRKKYKGCWVELHPHPIPSTHSEYSLSEFPCFVATLEIVV